MTLEELRKQIDELDRQLVALLSRRAEAALEAGRLKAATSLPIYEPAREFEFADLKGDTDRIGELAGGFSWQPGGPAYLAGGRAARISLSKSPMGSMMVKRSRRPSGDQRSQNARPGSVAILAELPSLR